ncbi:MULTISPECIES: phage tail protein [unclassified Pseudomonas]|uniref:phage tail protein n=1 Tax=unclassified Pseudomonas TaxID=196821 RepID=UPI002097876A|nr:MULTISPECIES: phage tail protein [unclassified Pseudomonas]MCO7519181.1 phage tail protein [Pseudomonas sp. 1]MCO7540135.1 phage tail protein [Pseudomonas sp. VA159-2]
MVDQSSQFYAILTNVGAAKQANADALGIPWKITQMGVGDANNTDPTPNASQTRLINEWRRAPLNQLKVDDNNAAIIVAEQIIPADVGGRWIREIALYDADGDMIAVANCPPTYKPLLSQGSGRTQVVRMNLIVSSASNVQLKIDPAVVLATREYVDTVVIEALSKLDYKHSVLVATTQNIVLSGIQTIDGELLPDGARVLVKDQNQGKDNGIYIVLASGAWKRAPDADASAEVTPGLFVSVEKGTANGDSCWQLVTDAPIVLGTTALVFEMVAGRTGVNAGTYRAVTVDKYGRVVGGTNPTSLSEYGIATATKDQAEAGADDAAPMTALRVLQAIAKFVVQATETVRGIAKIATSLQVATGTDDATFVTPKKLRGAGLGLSGIRTEDLSGANVTLAAADAGALVVFGGTGGGSLTLPKASTVRAGASITIHAASAVFGTNTLKVVAGDTLSGMLQFMAPAGVMRSGDSVVCTSDGTSNWVISVDCTYNYVAQAVAQLFTSGQSLVQVAGYQKLPGGLIEQWGIYSYTAAGTQALSIPLPIAFPNEMLSAMVTTPSRLNNTAVGADPVYTSTKSTLSFSSITNNGSGPMTIFYMAKGH